MLAFVGLHWPSLAFLAFVALDDFLKQKLAFVDKIQAQLTCFQQSDVKTNYQTRSGILKHCDAPTGPSSASAAWFYMPIKIQAVKLNTYYYV